MNEEIIKIMMDQCFHLESVIPNVCFSLLILYTNVTVLHVFYDSCFLESPSRSFNTNLLFHCILLFLSLSDRYS